MTDIEIAKALAWFIAGLVFFLFGMDIMSGNLKKLAGGKMDAKTAITMRSMLSLVGEVFGPERFLHEIERNMIVKLRSEILPRYPLNRRKHYPGKSLQRWRYAPYRACSDLRKRLYQLRRELR